MAIGHRPSDSGISTSMWRLEVWRFNSQLSIAVQHASNS
jgi:hypothetical protein